MMNLLMSLLEAAKNFALTHIVIIVLAAIAACLIWALIYFGTSAILRFNQRIWSKQSRALQNETIALLSNRSLVELYAPSAEYIFDEEEEGKKHKINAWLSPYSRAVKATSKRRKRLPRGQYFDARAQIREAAKRVNVRPLNEDELRTISIDPEAKEVPYVVELQYDGNSPAKIEAIISALETQLGVRELKPTPDKNPRAITLIALKGEFEDALVQLKPGAEFFEENPAKVPTSLPMALTAEGKVWALPTHHTFVYGETGSGKSGPLLATIRQAAPFVEKGTMKLYGIDPKAADLRLFEQSNLFEKIVVDTPDAIDLINDITAQMDRRSRENKPDLANGITGQESEATTKTPWVILMIDELFSLKKSLMVDKAGKAAWANLEIILAKGRAPGFFIMAASQLADKGNLEDMRGNFINWLVLRQESEHLNKVFLGENAAANGFDSTQLGISSKSNGYKYSGIGFVRGAGGQPEKVRFAYQSKEDLIEFILEHPKVEEPTLHEDSFIFTPSTVSSQEPKVELSNWGEDNEEKQPSFNQAAESIWGSYDDDDELPDFEEYNQ